MNKEREDLKLKGFAEEYKTDPIDTIIVKTVFKKMSFKKISRNSKLTR